MAEALGVAASVLGILDLTCKIADELPDIISALNGKWKVKLTQLQKDVNVFKERIEEVKEQGNGFWNESDYDLVKLDLVAVDAALQSLKEHLEVHDQSIWKCICIKALAARRKSKNPRELDEALGRFDLANDRVRDAALESGPRVSKILGELVGRERSEEVLGLLRRDRRLVITGAGGSGKTTLLKSTLAALSEDNWKDAYVHIGKFPKPVTELQCSILQQLDDSWNATLQSPDHGRGAIQRALSRLRNRKRKVLLAVDDVWDAELLRALLPSENLASLLQGYLVVTTRFTNVHSVVEEIWQLRSEKRADAYMLPPLVEGEAMKLFLRKAGLENDPAAEELAKQVVRRCGGMPLALEVVGAFFSDSANREQAAVFMEKWGSENDLLAEQVEGKVSKVLRTSVDFLEGATQEAFSDIVSFYRGWSWNLVGSIVGESLVRKLEDACLIKRVPHSQSPWWHRRHSQQIWVHDLIAALGKPNIRRGSTKEIIEFLATTGPVALDDIEGVWDEGFRYEDGRIPDGVQLPQHLGFMQRLRVLELRINTSFPPLSMPSLRYLCLDAASFARGLDLRGCAGLTVVKLQCCKIDLDQGLQASGGFPRCLRRLYLFDCDTPACLPVSLAECRKLEVLKITECSNLQRLPWLEVISQLTELRKLVVQDCPLLLEGPLRLEGPLEVITLKLGSRAFTSQQVLLLPPNLQLRTLRLRGLLPASTTATTSSSLHQHQPMLFPRTLQALHLTGLSGTELQTRLSGLPFGVLSALRDIDLSGCTKLTSLPDDIFAGLSALKCLNLSGCTSLTGLPDAIFVGLSALECLNLSGCTSLTGLPDATFGGLSALLFLSLSGCTSLIGLPNAVFEALSALQTLSLSGCTNLTGLPDAIFEGLSGLERLDLSGCTSLTGLPDTVLGGLYALRDIDLCACTSLIGLPDGVFEGLYALRTLSLSGCTSLTDLPDAIFRGLSTLEHLDLSGCTSLTGLPEAPSPLCKIRTSPNAPVGLFSEAFNQCS